MKAPSFNIGIEEEYQIIDPETGELRSYITQFLEDAQTMKLMELELKPELHQSIVEVGTRVCATPAEARQELIRLRSGVIQLAHRNGLKIASAGTHPFSHWRTQAITPMERYTTVRSDMAQLAQQLLIFGTHIHIGIEDREFMIDCMKVARYFVPHVLCLSTSSPFWLGEDTGLKSYRSVVFSNFPRTGIPDLFESVEEFDGYVNLLIKTGCIDNAKKIWWDIRLHPHFHTLEFRVCDIPMRVDETICLAAIMQAVIAKLYKLHRQNMGFRTYRARLINENRWRASRYGINGKMIDFGKQEEVPTRDLIAELLEFIDDVVDDLGSREEIDYVNQILRQGTGADRQVEVYNRTKDLKAVVDYIISETHHGLDL